MKNETLLLIVVVALVAAVGLVIMFMVLSGEKQSPVGCTDDAKLCPDGSYVSRNPLNNCEFDPCPVTQTNPEPTPQPIGCSKDAKVCPDGSTVGRVLPNCEFAECPEPAIVCGDAVCSPGEPDLEPYCEQDCGVRPVPKPPPETDRCQSEQALDKQAECYMIDAKAKNDPSLCEKITAVNFKPTCYKTYAIEKLDIGSCVKLTEDEAVRCINAVSNMLINYSECMEVPKTPSSLKDARNACLNKVAQKILSDDPCREITHQAKKASCVQGVAFMLGTEEGCRMLLEEDLWGPGAEGRSEEVDCFTDLVVDSLDISVCSNLQMPQDRWNCIYYGVLMSRLSSNGCTGVSNDDEYLCRAIADMDGTLCAFINGSTEKSWCQGKWDGELFCGDSDGGLDYYKKSYTIDNNKAYEDECSGYNEVLIEYICVDNDDTGGKELAVPRTYTCPKGCSDGACRTTSF